ncbi:MAG TPA: alcohol dehydrogenase catalytic domain-containing protein [Solirubrobacteraceae bacterium]|jgi:2-desacetyl-2-hydroxyethyl bacteriochlorophyllide A dehydrogenase|nr:alcohol dehydrogenase catalytic domain-containing protein [Solirubrobacteraceae bacterium]
MSNMQALVFKGTGEMAAESRPCPEPRADEVLVRVAAAGICGSELTSFTGHSTRRPPGRIFGHELAGVVEALGSAAPKELLGERVAVNPLHPCGRCEQCRSGRSNVCPERVLLGMQVDGGFAELVAVPYTGLTALGSLDELAGAMAEPIANAVHVAALLPATLGRHVAVLGAGAIGLSVVAVLRVAGAARITAVDPVRARRQAALASGAHAALAPDDGGLEGMLFDHVVDAAGTSGSRGTAIERCDAGGCVVLLGLHSAVSELAVNAAVAKELRLQCSYAYTQADFDAALELLRAGAVPYGHWITERPLDDGQAAFQTLVERPDEATKIVLRPPGA